MPLSTSQLVEEFKAQFPSNKATAGLILSVIDLVRAVRPDGVTYDDLDAFFAAFPRAERYPNGKPINQLGVWKTGAVGSRKSDIQTIRPFYNKATDLFREEHQRYDFPSSPHITGRWQDFRPWLDAIVAVENSDLAQLQDEVVAYVLATLPSQAYVPSGDTAAPRLFSKLLGRILEFNRPTGAGFQGAVYAFYRADAPHLFLDADKVRSGGKRGGRLGDIDGWQGKRRVLAVEAKAYHIGEGELAQFGNFINEVKKTGAQGVIVAQSFSDAARTYLSGHGIKLLDLAELTKIVSLWDELKENVAIKSFEFYLHRIEKKTNLQVQLDQFYADPDGALTEGEDDLDDDSDDDEEENEDAAVAE